MGGVFGQEPARSGREIGTNPHLNRLMRVNRLMQQATVVGRDSSPHRTSHRHSKGISSD